MNGAETSMAVEYLERIANGLEGMQFSFDWAAFISITLGIAAWLWERNKDRKESEKEQLLTNKKVIWKALQSMDPLLMHLRSYIDKFIHKTATFDDNDKVTFMEIVSNLEREFYSLENRSLIYGDEKTKDIVFHSHKEHQQLENNPMLIYLNFILLFADVMKEVTNLNKNDVDEYLELRYGLNYEGVKDKYNELKKGVVSDGSPQSDERI